MCKIVNNEVVNFYPTISAQEKSKHTYTQTKQFTNEERSCLKKKQNKTKKSYSKKKKKTENKPKNKEKREKKMKIRNNRKSRHVEKKQSRQ